VTSDAIGTGLPTVLSEFALSNAFLGKILEVCIVTEDHRRTMAGLVRLGIGPFRVYTFDDNVVAQSIGDRTAPSASRSVSPATMVCPGRSCSRW
jgi:hypothetical protein